jgi:hypothetical protein
MKSLILVIAAAFVFGVGCVNASPIPGDKIMLGDKFDIVCKHPMGHIERYVWEADRDGDYPYRYRSGIWSFIGVRVSDGKVLRVMSTFCHVEKEVD